MARPNAHERRAREVKAGKLMAVIGLLDPAPSADQVADWGTATWTILRRLAAVNPASDGSGEPVSKETRALIVAKLREREECPMAARRAG
jgi:hypothetical protein